MEIKRSDLADTYHRNTTNELLSMHQSGTLTKEAYEVLEEEVYGVDC